MKLILVLLLLAVSLVLFMVYHSYQFDYDKRDAALHKMSSSMKYIKPSFTFKSKEYKAFVYAK